MNGEFLEVGTKRSVKDEEDDDKCDLSYLDEQLSFDSGGDSQADRQIYELGVVVDPESGTYPTIQEAIDKAESKVDKQAIIKINSGLYKERVIIKDKSITLMCNDTNSEVYVSGETGQTIIIDNDPKYKVIIEGIHLSTKGTNSSKDDPVVKTRSPPQNKNEDSQNDSLDESKISQCYEDYKETTVEWPTCCIVYLVRGRLELRDCFINLNLMVKNCKTDIISLAMGEDTSAILTKCELRGKIDANCLGIYSDKANLTLNDCLLRDYKKGAVMLNCKSDNVHCLMKCQVRFNKRFGVMLVGENKDTVVEGCKIERNECPGIKVMAANKAIIRENEICINTEGIKVKSADPVINNNIIENNYRSGVSTSSVKVRTGTSSPMKGEVVTLQLTPRITNNEIKNNKEHGIYCYGANNYSWIKGNTISQNQMCGVKTQSEATPLILSNTISNNGTQGILFVENSWGKIIDNTIEKNKKANIALGGAESMNSYISNNRILDGMAEGIFSIKSGRLNIRSNQINGNVDGIILVDSHADVTNNTISNQLKHGIFMLQNSRPTIKDNLIQLNKEAGIYIKGRSNLAKITGNKIKDNATGVFLERKIHTHHLIKEKNELTNNQLVFPSAMCALI